MNNKNEQIYIALHCFIFLYDSFIQAKFFSGNFWHVTDIHLDQNYSRNGNPNNLCHKEAVHYQDNGLYGNFQCDSPEYLVDVTIKAMKTINYNPDFIIWTGYVFSLILVLYIFYFLKLFTISNLIFVA